MEDLWNLLTSSPTSKAAFHLIHDVPLRTCRKRVTIGTSGGRGSGKSVPVARHDDDDDLSINLCKNEPGISSAIYIYIYI